MFITSGSLAHKDNQPRSPNNHSTLLFTLPIHLILLISHLLILTFPLSKDHINRLHATIMANTYDAASDFPYGQYPEIEPLTKTLCDTGDVLLIADNGSHPALRIRVSSVLLFTASKVFRALLCGSFAEGEAIRTTAGRPVEIRVSDSPSDLLLLCQLLHFQGDLDKVRHARFLDHALIIDKYDCAQALRHVTTSKFSTLNLSGVDIEEHVCYLAAAWILDQPKFFRDLSKDIVTYYEHGPDAVEDGRLDILPEKVHSRFMMHLFVQTPLTMCSFHPCPASLRRSRAHVSP